MASRGISVDKGDLESEWKTNLFETEQSKAKAKPSYQGLRNSEGRAETKDRK